jgi:hypothetical protein
VFGQAISGGPNCAHSRPRGSPAVSFRPTASQWELRPTLPFLSCFLHNPKCPARRLLDLPLAFLLVFCSAYSTLKMEAIYSCKTSVDFQRTARCYIPEDRCENLKSYIVHSNSLLCCSFFFFSKISDNITFLFIPSYSHCVLMFPSVRIVQENKKIWNRII